MKFFAVFLFALVFVVAASAKNDAEIAEKKSNWIKFIHSPPFNKTGQALKACLENIFEKKTTFDSCMKDVKDGFGQGIIKMAKKHFLKPEVNPEVAA